MENHKLVMVEDLNQYGYLFGGSLLKWVDEYAWIAASMDYPACNFVTIGMDHVEFRKSVRSGTILKFMINKSKVGSSSVSYQVTVLVQKKKINEQDPIFSTTVTFVSIDSNGRKKNLVTCDCTERD